MRAQDVIKALRQYADPDRARASAWFFKTGKGGYGEGDVFFGVRVPQQRRIAKQFRNIELREVSELFSSPIHECRLCACLILVYRYQAKSMTESGRREIYDLYTRHLLSGDINNWDMIDTSVPHIVGEWLADRKPAVLYGFARNPSLWVRRAGILATAAFIRRHRYDDTVGIAETLLHDPEDLIHKAVGWMLREVGKRNIDILLSFLNQHRGKMPRTMLRYAIERLPEAQRKAYLSRQSV